MTSTAFDDQFAVCTPEEDALFDEIQARKDEQAARLERENQDYAAAICAIRDQMNAPFIDPTHLAVRIHAAIKAGRIPGVVLGGGHE